jgi:hypothetical protein
MSGKKTIWSLQSDKRSEEERNVFKPTGKHPKNKTLAYIIWALVVVLISSFALTFLQEASKEICFTSGFCFDSKKNVLLFAFYIFLNIITVVLAILVAYIIGRNLANLIKR